MSFFHILSNFRYYGRPEDVNRFKKCLLFPLYNSIGNFSALLQCQNNNNNNFRPTLLFLCSPVLRFSMFCLLHSHLSYGSACPSCNQLANLAFFNISLPALALLDFPLSFLIQHIAPCASPFIKSANPLGLTLYSKRPKVHIQFLLLFRKP